MEDFVRLVVLPGKTTSGTVIREPLPYVMESFRSTDLEDSTPVATAKDEEISRLRGELNLARQAYDQGQFDRAEPVFRRALLFFEHGDDLRQCLQCLAVLYSIRNQFSDALEMYVRLLALNELEYGKTDRRSIAVMREMASIYVQMGQKGKADKMIARAHIREQELERPYRAELEAEENRIAQQQSYAFLEPNDPLATAAQAERMEMERQQELARQKREKREEEVRPLISGLIVDFSNFRNLFIAKAISAAIVFLFIFMIAMFAPHNPDPIDVFKAIPHEYKTADGKGSFTIEGESNCKFANNEDKSISLPYTMYLADWRDFLGMMYGAIYEKQYLVFRQDDAVLDGDKRIYYGANTPEAQVITEMAAIKKTADTYLHTNEKYPDEITDQIMLPYINPITKLPSLPFSQKIKVGDRTWTTETSLEERNLFYSKLVDGKPWPNEPPLKPGGINCCSVVMVSAAGEFYDYLIRGSDRHGQTLSTSTPGKPYLISLQNPKEFDKPTPPIPFENKLLVRPRYVCLMRPGVSDFEIHFLNHALTYIVGLLGTCLILFWAKNTFIDGEDYRELKKFWIYGLGCYFLCLLYELSRICP
jgi:hypothetical protein